MKASIILLFFFPLLGSAATPAPPTGGKDKYQAIMRKHIELIDTAVTESSFIKAANTFERVAKAEPTEWLPPYYAAYGYLNAAMVTQDLDRVDMYCDQAEALLLQAEELEGAEPSEISCLLALSSSLRIRVDLFARGMEYSALSDHWLAEAERADPDNPRIHYLRGHNLLGRPKQFGGGSAPARPYFELAKQKFDARPLPADSLDPDWGRKKIEIILEQYRTK
jgi:hypothetical protein